MFGLVGFRRDEKDWGEKNGEKIIFLECLVGVILGEKIGGAKYFFFGCTRTFSPQFREKTQMICLVILVLFVPSIAMLKSLNRHLSFFLFFFFFFPFSHFFLCWFVLLSQLFPCLFSSWHCELFTDFSPCFSLLIMLVQYQS